MTIWFSSDTHYGHANIIAYAKRPFSSVEEMDETMIERWNAVVKPQDIAYHLGDFALCRKERAAEIARRLAGRKFYIFGNHDDRYLRDNADFLACWLWARDLTQVAVSGQTITLCHYAMRTWPSAHHGTWQLFGHSHGSLPDIPTMRTTDVGVDCWKYAPVSFDELRIMMDQREWTPVDHHK